jgi:hypothetical protein
MNETFSDQPIDKQTYKPTRSVHPPCEVGTGDGLMLSNQVKCNPTVYLTRGGTSRNAELMRMDSSHVETWEPLYAFNTKSR